MFISGMDVINDLCICVLHLKLWMLAMIQGLALQSQGSFFLYKGGILQIYLSTCLLLISVQQLEYLSGDLVRRSRKGPGHLWIYMLRFAKALTSQMKVVKFGTFSSRLLDTLPISLPSVFLLERLLESCLL